MDVSKPYEFIGFGAMDVSKPCEFIGFGAMDVSKPYEFIRFGAMDVSKSCEFIGFGGGLLLHTQCTPPVSGKPSHAMCIEPSVLTPSKTSNSCAETKPYKFIGVGAIDGTKPYKSPRFGAIEVTKPYIFIGFGAMDVTKPYIFIGFGASSGRKDLSARPKFSPPGPGKMASRAPSGPREGLRFY